MFERDYKQELLTRAITIAAEAHRHQEDKTGHPYILHPLAVMQKVAPDTEAMIVAVLHDVIEDTPIQFHELVSVFPDNIVEAIKLISREPFWVSNRPTYKEYIARLAPNKLARIVKIADLEHNMSPERFDGLPSNEKSMMKRYKSALEYLEQFSPAQ